MANSHIVEQGEHVAGIAWRYGFADFRTVWDHPDNAALKSLRKNPNVLFPGDSLFIPDKEPKQIGRPTDKSHRFVRKSPTLALRVTLRGQYGEPIANATCQLTLSGGARPVTTDDEGKIELDIPLTEKLCSLQIDEGQETSYSGVSIPIRIGHLDPVDEFSGQAARLRSLGYLAVPVEDESSPDFLSAVEEFQCEQDLAVDGKCGPLTQAKLKEVFGC